jgi:hypothetical protein
MLNLPGLRGMIMVSFGPITEEWFRKIKGYSGYPLKFFGKR